MKCCNCVADLSIISKKYFSTRIICSTNHISHVLFIYLAYFPLYYDVTLHFLFFFTCFYFPPGIRVQSWVPDYLAWPAVGGSSRHRSQLRTTGEHRSALDWLIDLFYFCLPYVLIDWWLDSMIVGPFDFLLMDLWIDGLINW